MRVLLDTCTFVWLLGSPSLVPERARDLLERDADAVVVSAASAWELSIKRKLGKLGELSPIARDLGAFVRQAIETTSSRSCRSTPRTLRWPAIYRCTTVIRSIAC